MSRKLRYASSKRALALRRSQSRTFAQGWAKGEGQQPGLAQLLQAAVQMDMGHAGIVGQFLLRERHREAHLRGDADEAEAQLHLAEGMRQLGGAALGAERLDPGRLDRMVDRRLQPENLLDRRRFRGQRMHRLVR